MQTNTQLTDRLIAAEVDVECRFAAGEQPAPGSAMEAQMAAYHRLAARLRAVDPQHPALATDPR